MLLIPVIVATHGLAAVPAPVILAPILPVELNVELAIDAVVIVPVLIAVIYVPAVTVPLLVKNMPATYEPDPITGATSVGYCPA